MIEIAIPAPQIEEETSIALRVVQLGEVFRSGKSAERGGTGRGRDGGVGIQATGRSYKTHWPGGAWRGDGGTRERMAVSPLCFPFHRGTWFFSVQGFRPGQPGQRVRAEKLLGNLVGDGPDGKGAKEEAQDWVSVVHDADTPVHRKGHRREPFGKTGFPTRLLRGSMATAPGPA